MGTERASSRRTRTGLLDSALTCLAESGYAGLSLRVVADHAGVPVSQIHYHFGGKEGLMLAVLEHRNAQLLDRQRTMYAGAEPLWKKWEQACDYLEADLASGYVRVLQELIAVGWSDPAMAAALGAELEGWVDVLTSVAEEAVAALHVRGIEPRQVAILVGAAFLGAEELELLGLGESGDVRGALRAVGELIRMAEEEV